MRSNNQIKEPNQEKSNKTKIPNWVMLTTFVISIVIILYYAILIIPSKPIKIAYVNTLQVIEKYYGTKESNEQYDKKMKSWQANIDTLESEIQDLTYDYNSRKSILTKLQMSSMENDISRKKEFVENYKLKLSQAAKVDENERGAQISKKIKETIDNFGKQNSYDIIFGTTLTGNILYGGITYDVTNDIIRILNNNFKQEKNEKNKNEKSN